MVDVVPFRGLLYNLDKAGPLEHLIAPPYDVIRPDMQESLYARNPFNVVRLILGRQTPEDSAADNRYTRSARDFQIWRNEGVLTPDSAPAFYVYSQEYEFEGQRINRVGFFARVGLEPFEKGNICPHEWTLAKAKLDRAQLIRACRANFSPVFGLYSDPEKFLEGRLEAASKGAPLHKVEEDGVIHRLWRITDTDTQTALSAWFRDKKVYIADGHHRYETALGYYQEVRVPDAAWVLMFLTNLDAEGLVIYPIHRQVKMPGVFDRKEFLQRAGEFFHLEPRRADATGEALVAELAKAGEAGTMFCAYFGGGEAVMMRLLDETRARPFMAPDESESLLPLDVFQLHKVVLQHLLGIDTKTPEGQKHMHYNVRVQEAKEQVDAGRYDMVFFMNSTPIQQVRRLAEKGVRLPQKATYFYPKLLSGLVINPFRS